MVESCTRISCFLSGKEALISLPLVTVAGLVDGINPCGLAMLVFLLGYLVVFLERRDRVLPVALSYIGSVFTTYLVLGLFLYESLSRLSLYSLREGFNGLLASVLVVFGAISLKDYFFPQIGPHLKIPAAVAPKLRQIARQVTIPSTIFFASLVTIFEAPCSLPLYAGTARILLSSGLPFGVVLFYFLYYNLLFILPLILVAVAFFRGVAFLKIEDFTHGQQPKMQLILGILLVLFGFLLFFW